MRLQQKQKSFFVILVWRSIHHTSMQIKKKNFQFVSFQKAKADYLIRFAVIAGNDTIEKETLPVQVQRGKKISVLMLSSSPDFDTKFIKNLLASQGHSVVARTTISKNKYSSDFLNAQQISLDRITASLLDNFNVVIADATALSSLPKGEEAAIQSQIVQKGLGLLIKGDSAVASSFYSALFPVRGGAKDSSQLLSLSLSDTAVKLPPLATANSFFYWCCPTRSRWCRTGKIKCMQVLRCGVWVK